MGDGVPVGSDQGHVKGVLTSEHFFSNAIDKAIIAKAKEPLRL